MKSLPLVLAQWGRFYAQYLIRRFRERPFDGVYLILAIAFILTIFITLLGQFFMFRAEVFQQILPWVKEGLLLGLGGVAWLSGVGILRRFMQWCRGGWLASLPYSSKDLHQTLWMMLFLIACGWLVVLLVATGMMAQIPITDGPARFGKVIIGTTLFLLLIPSGVIGAALLGAGWIKSGWLARSGIHIGLFTILAGLALIGFRWCPGWVLCSILIPLAGLSYYLSRGLYHRKYISWLASLEHRAKGQTRRRVPSWVNRAMASPDRRHVRHMGRFMLHAPTPGGYLVYHALLGQLLLVLLFLGGGYGVALATQAGLYLGLGAGLAAAQMFVRSVHSIDQVYALLRPHPVSYLRLLLSVTRLGWMLVAVVLLIFLGLAATLEGEQMLISILMAGALTLFMCSLWMCIVISLPGSVLAARMVYGTALGILVLFWVQMPYLLPFAVLFMLWYYGRKSRRTWYGYEQYG